MRFTVAEIARLIGGEVLGDPGVDITGVAGIREAQPGDLTFLANRRYETYLKTTRASAIILGERNGASDRSIIVHSNPYLAYLKVVELFVPREPYPRGIHPSAVVGLEVRMGADVGIGATAVVEDRVSLGDRATLYPGCYVGRGTVIGADCLLYPGVVVMDGCVIGERVVIHSGTVIGSDGFGFARNGDRYQKIPQIGNVAIGDDVEIGSNVSIDRATTGTTSIGRGTKIDNLVQIGHNVVVGENCIIVAQVGVSGSTELGRNVTLAGQAGLAGHIHIGDNARVGAQAGVIKSVPGGESVSGYPARPHREALRVLAGLEKLPELMQRVRTLEERIRELQREDARP